MPAADIEKRLKRHVRGKPREFFIIVPPGLESLCAGELRSLAIPFSDMEISRGGITVLARLPFCYHANLHLRTASRVLMRLGGFTAESFRRLERHLAAFPWELYVFRDAAITFSVSARRSRLIHTDAIAERCAAAAASRLKDAGVPDPTPFSDPEARGGPQQMFIRAENDRFLLSLDTSGALLHRRGMKTQGGRAPVRETLAAAMLTLSGYRPGGILVDPMCGTGTFSLEAAMMSKAIPPGWFRDFAFTGWPAFQAATWDHIRREAEHNITVLSGPAIFASDADNMACAKLGEVVKARNVSDAVTVACGDFFDLQGADYAKAAGGRPGLVILNPPYGRRLGAGDTIAPLFAEIGRKLKKDFAGWTAALVVPEKELLRHLPFANPSTHDFPHGGLTVTLAWGPI